MLPTTSSPTSRRRWVGDISLSGGGEQERLDVLVAEMFGPAGRCGLVIVIRGVEVGPAGDEQLGGAPLPAPGRGEMQRGRALRAAIAAPLVDGGAVIEQPG